MKQPATDDEVVRGVRYDCHIHLKLTEDMEAQVKAAARQQNKKVSEFFRDMVRDHLASKPLDQSNAAGGGAA